MIKKVLLLSLIGSFMNLPLVAEAEISRRVDKDGVVHLSNLFTAPKKRSQKATKQNKKKPKLTTIKENIRYYAERYGVDPDLVSALIRVESDFQPRAVSRSGAKGLMQLMPTTASRYGVKNPFDPEENIRGGVKYLRYLLDLFNGDTKLAVAAFNAGENSVIRSKRVPRVTESFVKRVMAFYQKGKMLSGDKIYSYVGPDGTLVYTNSLLF